MLKQNKTLFAFIVCLSGICCNKIPSTRPTDFGFILEYGIFPGKNKIDTFKSIIIKDLIENGDTTITYHFSNHQLDSIYGIVREINYFDYPDDYSPKGAAGLPASRTRIFVKVDGLSKEIRWTGYLYEPEDKNKLGYLCDFIIHNVKESQEYKMLPEPKGGYY